MTLSSALPSLKPAEISTTKRGAAWLLSLAAGLLRLGASLRGKPLKERRRVVIFEPFGMGDAISLLPLVEGLLRMGKEVVVCARSPWKALFPPGVIWVDAVVPWNTYDDAKKHRLKSFWSKETRRCLSALREQGAACGIDPRGDIRGILFLWLAGCREVISLDRYLGSNLKVPCRAARRLPYNDRLRRWELNATFLQGFPGEAGVSVGPPDLREASREPGNGRDAAPLPPPTAADLVGLVPVSPWAGKHWPPERWLSLSERLRQRGCEVVVFCGPGQSAEALKATAGAGRAQVCASVEEWMRFLSRCRAVVTVDSGPMHLAAALGVPLVALYGLGSLPLWAPAGPESVILHRLDDGDYENLHPTGEATGRGQELMSRHEVGTVWQALQRLLSPVVPPDQP